MVPPYSALKRPFREHWSAGSNLSPLCWSKPCAAAYHAARSFAQWEKRFHFQMAPLTRCANLLFFTMPKIPLLLSKKCCAWPGERFSFATAIVSVRAPEWRDLPNWLYTRVDYGDCSTICVRMENVTLLQTA